MSFRILDQAPAYRLANGTIAAGGSLTFYETDLSTLKDTWSDEALETLNSNPVLLDAAGRTVTDVWGDGEYGVVLKNALGVPQWTRNNVRPGDTTDETIPAPTDADTYLSWNGSAYEWLPIIQVPDPSDLSNHYLVSDGTSTPVWQQFPDPQEIPDPEIVIVDSAPLSVRVGVSDDTTKLLTQYGSGTVPTAAARSSSVEITLPVVLDKAFGVRITPRTLGTSTAGPGLHGATYAVSGYTVGSAMTSFTVTVLTTDDGGGDYEYIENPWDFDWEVVGTVTVEVDE